MHFSRFDVDNCIDSAISRLNLENKETLSLEEIKNLLSYSISDSINKYHEKLGDFLASNTR